MQPRTRVLAVVFLAAAAAAGVTVGVTAWTSDPEPAAARPPCPEGPPLQLDLGVRTDPQARALRRASAQLAGGRREQAARTFERYGSVDARVGAAVAGWPSRTLAELRALAAERPRAAVVRLHLGAALACDGRLADGRAQWREAERLAPDSLLATRAADFLHPEYPIPGVPLFVPSFDYPRGLAKLPPPRQLAELRRRARAPDIRARLLYGVALQRLGRQRSAERVYARASRLAPADVDAQVAAAVGRYTKERPSAAFSRLGPLSRRFPQAATVRFHLGLLLLWLGQVDAGRRQLGLAHELEPRSPIGREARLYLDSLGGVGTP